MNGGRSFVSPKLLGAVLVAWVLPSCGYEAKRAGSESLSPPGLQEPVTQSTSACVSLSSKKAAALTEGDFARIDSCSDLRVGAASSKKPSQERCDSLAAEVDALPGLGALPEFLKKGTNQDVVRDLFLCAPETESVPNNVVDADLLRGDGWGSLVANTSVPFWNQFQSHVGRLVWGGKVLHRKPSGEVYLRNMMLINKTMAFEAKVYVSSSIVDRRKALTLDYRRDSTAGLLSQTAIRRIRDELREIHYRGQPSRVFVGRANVFTGKLSELDSDKFDSAQNFFFGANFILDFRPELQRDIPDWARQPL